MDVTAALEKAEAVVKELIEFRDSFVLNEGIEKAHLKNEEVDKKLKEALLNLDSLQLSIDNKGSFFYLRGKALNTSVEFDPHSVECLSKAVKLNPGLIEAWNELGECYWKDKKVDAAYNCFAAAIAKKKNKVSLRNLSMVQRQLGNDFESKVTSIRESVTTAKEAVSMDVTDGHSWFVLGNAYLSLFFFAGQNPGALKQCMAAYTRACKDKIESNNPDLHFNRAVAHKYQENFTEALDGYKMASLLDPSWNEPKHDRNDLVKRLKLSVDYLQNKAHLKPKRLNTFINQIKDSDYGPFASGVYTSPLNNTISVKKVSLKDLGSEKNDNVVVCGKVIAVIPVKDTVPFPFILMDRCGDCIAVSVFNLSVNKGMIVGDSVAIPEPYVQLNEVGVENEKLSFRNIRVDNPVVMVINKRKVGPERLAFSVLAVTNKSE